MNGRLSGFTFALTRDGVECLFTFYAASLAAALKLARPWATQRSWTVEEPEA